MKTFTFAGVSKHKGQFKARFANDAARVKVLEANDHYDIDIVQLKHAMTKQEAVEYLLSIDFDCGNAEVRAALTSELDKRSGKTSAAEPVSVEDEDIIQEQNTEFAIPDSDFADSELEAA